MAKFQRGNSLGSGPEKELGEKMFDLSDDEGPEEVTFNDSKVIALKSAKDVRDSVQRYSGLGLLPRTLLWAKTQITYLGGYLVHCLVV